MIVERLDAARLSVRTHTKAQIDTDTAAVWGARAVAAYEMFAATGEPHWRDDSLEYRHEALEHAAVGVPGTFELISHELSSLMRL